MSNEKQVSQLIEEAELNIAASNHKEAEHRLFQALEIAKQWKLDTELDGRLKTLTISRS